MSDKRARNGQVAAAKELLRLLEDSEFLQELANHYTEIAKHPVDVAVLKEAIERSAEEHSAPEGKKNFFLDELLPTANLIAGVLLNRPWQVWEVSGKEEFITSDNPIVTMLPTNGNFALGFGFHRPGVLVAFPLNPTSCLIMGREGSKFQKVDAETVAKINDVQVFACSKPRTVGLDPRPLKPQLMNTGDM